MMQNLHAKLTAMETLCASQEKQITLLAGSVATAAAAVEISEKRYACSAVKYSDMESTL